MKSYGKKIAAGLIIASININLFGILLFPSCFGFVLVYLGLHDLEKSQEGTGETGQKGHRGLDACAAALVLVSASADFLSVVPTFALGGIWLMIPSILEYAVLYGTLDLCCKACPSASGFRRAYAAVMGAVVCGYGISLIFASEGWQLFCAIGILLCRLLVLKAVFGDKG